MKVVKLVYCCLGILLGLVVYVCAVIDYSRELYITHGSRKAKAKAIVNLRFMDIMRPARR